MLERSPLPCGNGGIYRVLRFLQLGTPGSGLGMNGL